MDLLRYSLKRRRLDASGANFIEEQDLEPQIRGSTFSPDQPSSSTHILFSAGQQSHTVAAPGRLPATPTTYLDTGGDWQFLNTPAPSPAPWINDASQQVQLNSPSHVPTSGLPYLLASCQADFIPQQFSESQFTPYYGAFPQNADGSAWPMSAQAEEEQNEIVCFGMVSVSRNAK